MNQLGFDGSLNTIHSLTENKLGSHASFSGRQEIASFPKVTVFSTHDFLQTLLVYDYYLNRELGKEFRSCLQRIRQRIL